MVVLLALALMVGCSDAPTSRAPSAPPETSEPADSAAPVACPCPGAFDPLQVGLLESGADMVMTYGEAGTRRDELVVFLHGTNQSPGHHTWILQTSAYAGYRTLGLQYQSDPDMSEICRESYPEEEWAECGEEGHRAKLYGSEHPAYVDVTDESSLVGRLHTRLVELHLLEPDAGWDTYFLIAPPDAIDHERYIVWDRILLAGFSQGGGHAAFLAIDQEVDGVVLMSGPPDPPDYLDWVRPGATPACAWIGFRHEEEDYGAFIGENWDLAAIPGADASIELPLDECWTTWPSFDGAQRFVSTLAPGDAAGCTSADPAHGSMAHNPCMNVADAPEGDTYTLFRPYLYAFCRAGDLDHDGAGGCTSP